MLLSMLLLGLVALALNVAAGDRTNFSGDVKIAAPSGGVTRGLAYLIGGRVMVARETAAAGVLCLFAMSGPVTVTKPSADTFAIGDKVYFDATAHKFTSTSASNTLVGTAISVQASGDLTVDTLLEGLSPTAT